MAVLNFYKVTSLPSTLVADAFYYVENGNYAESYLTDENGVAKMVGNSTMINALIAAELANWSGVSSQVVIVADLSARNALAQEAEANLMVLVLDASDDATVDEGSALYAYALASETWYKIAEYEAMDVSVSWGDITGGPSSTPVQIDDAVTKAHQHTNKTALDKVGEDANGDMTYNGAAVKTQWQVKNW